MFLPFSLLRSICKILHSYFFDFVEKRVLMRRVFSRFHVFTVNEKREKTKKRREKYYPGCIRQDKKDKILFVLFFTNFRHFPLFLKTSRKKYYPWCMRQDKKDKILFVLFFTNFRDCPLFLKKVKKKIKKMINLVLIGAI